MIKIHTDGACSGNPGKGGWGALVDDREICGGEKHTTNNRMELRAAIEGLRATDHGALITMYVDSQYVRNGITSWIKGWKKNGWKTRGGSPVKNQDLWCQLDQEVSVRKVKWVWVKGHNGHPGNEVADRLARVGMNSA